MSSLVKKGLEVKFSEAELNAPAREPADKPRTAVGALSEAFAVGRGAAKDAERLKGEKEALEQRLAELIAAGVVQRVDPGKIRPSQFANRHEDAFRAQAFLDLKKDIEEAGGNVQAIKVRPLARPDGVFEYEVVYGHRRHRACLESGLLVNVLVETLSDQQLVAEMERENREREDLSPWEQATMYDRVLQSGLYPSAARMAAELGVSKGTLSKLFALLKLPDVVVGAFRSPLEIQFQWIHPLKQAVEENSDQVCARARDLVERPVRLSAPATFAHLIGQVKPARQMVSHGGAELFSVARRGNGGVQFTVPAGQLDDETEGRLIEALKAVLVERAQGSTTGNG